MDTGIVQGLWTLVSLVTFVAISVWAYSRRRKKDFDAAARIPFDEDTESQDEPGERHG